MQFGLFTVNYGATRKLGTTRAFTEIFPMRMIEREENISDEAGSRRVMGIKNRA